MSDLKPCPFCGGEAELVEGEYGMYLTGYAIYCKGTCGAKLGVTGRLCEAYEWIPYFDTEAKAIVAWNTRHQCGLTDEDYNILLDELGISERTCKPTEEYCCQCGQDLVLCDMGIGPNGGAVELDPPILFNYCPNCGAKVRNE